MSGGGEGISRKNSSLCLPREARRTEIPKGEGESDLSRGDLGEGGARGGGSKKLRRGEARWLPTRRFLLRIPLSPLLHCSRRAAVMPTSAFLSATVAPARAGKASIMTRAKENERRESERGIFFLAPLVGKGAIRRTTPTSTSMVASQGDKTFSPFSRP